MLHREWIYLLQTRPKLPVDDVPVRVLGQEVEQQLSLYLCETAAAVRGDALLEFRPGEDSRAVGVLAAAEGLQLPDQAVELGVVERVYCLSKEGNAYDRGAFLAPSTAPAGDNGKQGVTFFE